MSSSAPLLVHGTAVALGPLAALIRGASGSGKSDLALRCLGVPAGLLTGGVARLVADDQVVVTRDAHGVRLSAPPTIAGKLEVRGLGIVEVGQVEAAQLALVVDLVAPASVERMPDEQTCTIAGFEVPLIALAPFEASAPLKLLLCLRRFSAPNP
jgi:serine kinase of HPr protein (carbohydrate metabolism regulator)